MSDLVERSYSYDNSTDETVHMYQAKDGGTPALISTWSGLHHLDRGGMQGFSIPNFHSRKRKGELLPQTPWKRWNIRGSMGGQYDHEYLYLGHTYHQTIDADYVLPDSSQWASTLEELENTTALDYGYVQEAAAKIYSQGFDALTWLAELASLRGLFLNAAKKFAHLRLPSNWREKFRKYKTLKDLSDEWLELRYGWRTTLYDIDQISQLIAEWNVKRARCSERSGILYEDSATSTWTSESTYFTRLHTLEQDVKVGLTGTVTADITVPKLQFNLLQTAWELIPLSFVVDWFLSVGKSLSAMSFLIHQSKYSAAAGLYVQIKKRYDINISQTKPGFISGNCWSRGESVGELRLRTPCNVPITPHLTMRLNTFKVFDLLGLIVQRFK